jgi:protein CLEC16A
MDLSSEISKAKCLISYNFKYTSEMVERLNLKMLHVIHRLDNLSTVFDLEFANKTHCNEAKQMIESKKSAYGKTEVSLVKTYLKALIRTLNYIK